MRTYGLAILVLLVIVASLVFLLTRRRQKRQAVPRQKPEAFPDFPEHPFHQLCRQAGVRYIGELARAYAHGVFVKMDREGELLYAQVPVSAFDIIQTIHRQVCSGCHHRVYDLYVTGPQTLDTRFYGPCSAYRIGTVCGTCGKTQEQQIEYNPPNIQALRQLLVQKGDARSFLLELTKTKTAP